MFILFGCINNTLILIICQVEIEKFFNLKQKNLEILHKNVIPRRIYAISLWKYEYSVSQKELNGLISPRPIQ